MILADKIIYLRKQAGFSQEDLAAEINVSRQSVSKWEGAQSIPDMDKILQLSQLFGVSTDFLLKDEIEELDGRHISATSLEIRKLSLEDASRYIEINKEIAPKLALGVFLCIISPILLIYLTSTNTFNLSENQATAIGLSVLLILVASAVSLFILLGSKTKEYEFLEKEDFELHYGVESVILERQKKEGNRHLVHLVFGIVLCITSIIPVLFGMDDSGEILGVSLMIVLIAVGVYNIVYGYTMNSIYNKILMKNEYTSENKRKERKGEVIGAIYWPLMVLIYLSYSFLTNNWTQSWIIWPIAGILFAVIMGVVSSISDK